MCSNCTEACEIEKSDFSNNLNSENITLSVPKINGNTSYSEFFQTFLIPNKPCLILNVTNNWACKNDWVQNDCPNFNYLLKYKNLEATVSNCKERSFNAHKTEPYTVGKYISYWQNLIENKYDPNLPLLYLKDWHLKKLTGENFYFIPIYFSSDWLNEYFSEKTNDDYKFVYMGPKGTWTPFHADVFTSYSWSVNICGKKKWVLFPPGEETHLKDNLGNLPYDISTLTQQNSIEIIQNSGDAMFIPSGWHHQVWNLEDTISINHNWVNGCNIRNMWHSLSANLDAVKKEIADCASMDGWLNHCQLMLNTSYGLDFEKFYDFLHYIADKRIRMLKDGLVIVQFDKWVLGVNHAIFDLTKVKEVLELFIQHTDFHILKCSKHNISPNELLSTINSCLININNIT